MRGEAGEAGNDGGRYVIFVPSADGIREVEVSAQVYEAIREAERSERSSDRRAAEHCMSDQLVLEGDIPIWRYSPSAEQEYFDRLADRRLKEAICSLPKVQRRRLILHCAKGLTVKEIAEIEGSSWRAVYYSLAIAKRNLAIALGMSF